MSFAKEVYDYLTELDENETELTYRGEKCAFELEDFVQSEGVDYDDFKYNYECVVCERINSTYSYVFKFSDDNNECYIRWEVPYSSWEGIMWDYGGEVEEVYPEVVSVVQYKKVKSL